MTQNDPNDRDIEDSSSSSSSGGAKRKRDGESDASRKSSKKVGAGDHKIEEENSKSASNPTPGNLSKTQEKTAQDHNENEVVRSDEADQEPAEEVVEMIISRNGLRIAPKKIVPKFDEMNKSKKSEEFNSSPGDEETKSAGENSTNPGNPGTSFSTTEIKEKPQDQNENDLGIAEDQEQDQNVGHESAEQDQEPLGKEIFGVDMKVVEIPWPYSLRADTDEPLKTTRLTFQNWTIDVANFRGNAPLSLSMDQLPDGGVKMTIPGHLGCHNKMDHDLVTLRIWEGSHFWNTNGNDVYLRIPPGFDLKETKISQNGDFVQIIAPRITQNQNQTQDQTQDQNQTQNQNQD